ncbi:ADP-ribosylglycohydrolase family protein [Halothermothrix orenii]|uniref:ADP-ribosylation/Crystallin J1 n=1 Tax=Halothermothrix orenii (strain H 168 / OCM 544 / DSM 9562) TaxID=373903 RepID=B8D1Z3_HALOH|nr:ADP-ribosylglycohydrolase family protein [Halothermothrix orenii]ACL69220.1 ADP-ribosylation/Crystallin J1 [Halothermothrix orenii H 168]
MTVKKDKALGALVGLAVGDALGQPTEGKTCNEIKEKWGRITDFLDDTPAVSDDTEYALFNARLLLDYGEHLDTDKITDAWVKEIASQHGGFKGAGFSEMATIENLRNGLRPPDSGKHIHSWSDGLAMRVAPFGIVAAGDPELAARLARMDGEVSHAGEGIYAGMLVAATISLAMTEKDKEIIFNTSLNMIPSDSWTYRAVCRGINIGQKYSNIWEVLEPLYKETVFDCYPWADLAPEALGLTYGILTVADFNFVDSVVGGVNIGRDTDTNAAIAGAIAGAYNGIDVIPQKWQGVIKPSEGRCIHTVEGMVIDDIALKLSELGDKWGAAL